MADEFIVIIPNEVIRRFEKTDGGYKVYVWQSGWILRDHVSDATAEWYFKVNQTFVKHKERVPELFRMRVIAFMSLLDDYHIRLEEGKWHVSTEWLIGCFAGRVFISDDLDTAVDEMIEYFNRHIGHESIVGEIVRESGWPDIEKVKAYLASEER